MKRCEVCQAEARVEVVDLIRSDAPTYDWEKLSFYRRGSTHYFCFAHKRDSQVS